MKWFTRLTLVMVLVVLPLCVIAVLSIAAVLESTPEPATRITTPLDDQIRYAIDHSNL